MAEVTSCVEVTHRPTSTAPLQHTRKLRSAPLWQCAPGIRSVQRSVRTCKYFKINGYSCNRPFTDSVFVRPKHISATTTDVRNLLKLIWSQLYVCNRRYPWIQKFRSGAVWTAFPFTSLRGKRNFCSPSNILVLKYEMCSFIHLCLFGFSLPFFKESIGLF